MNAVGEEVGQAEGDEAEHQAREAGEQFHNVGGDESRRAVDNGSGENADKEIGHVDELYDDSIGRDFFQQAYIFLLEGGGPDRSRGIACADFKNLTNVLPYFCREDTAKEHGNIQSVGNQNGNGDRRGKPWHEHLNDENIRVQRDIRSNPSFIMNPPFSL